MIALLLARWQLVLIAALSAFAFVSTQLYLHEVKKYNAFVAEVQAAGELQKEKNKKDEEANATFVETKEREHAAEIRSLTTAWNNELNRLRGKSRGGTLSEPVRTDTRICADPADNERLSVALFQYEQGIGNAVREYQTGVGQLLANADKDAAAIRKINEWAAGEQLLNRE